MSDEKKVRQGKLSYLRYGVKRPDGRWAVSSEDVPFAYYLKADAESMAAKLGGTVERIRVTFEQDNPHRHKGR